MKKIIEIEIKNKFECYILVMVLILSSIGITNLIIDVCEKIF